jgi:hypothetical protein
MAQQTQTPGGQKKSSGAAPPATGSSNGFLGGLRSFFSPAPPANSSTKAGATSTTKGGGATAPARPTLNLRKVILGFLLLLVGVYAIQFLLLFIDLQMFKGKLQTTILVQVPLLGPLSIFSALALASMIGLYVLLYRLDLLPRANRASAQASAASANNRARTTATKKPVEKSATVRQPVSGPHDDEYEQARLAQRAKRRRDARK